MLRFARLACRVAAVLILAGGAAVLIAPLAAGSFPRVGPLPTLVVLFAGVVVLVFACVYASLFWAAGDMITIALRLEATLPASRHPL